VIPFTTTESGRGAGVPVSVPLHKLLCGLATKRDTQSVTAQEQTICNNVVVVTFHAFNIRGLTSLVSTAKILHYKIIYDNG